MELGLIGTAVLYSAGDYGRLLLETVQFNHTTHTILYYNILYCYTILHCTYPTVIWNDGVEYANHTYQSGRFHLHTRLWCNTDH